jgi:hypothetical protein
MTNPAKRHTPAPWAIEFGIRSAAILDSATNEIAVVEIGIHDAETEAELRTNAQLIATAPDLLDALQKLVDANLNGSLFVVADAVSNAKSVITKATGGKK